MASRGLLQPNGKPIIQQPTAAFNRLPTPGETLELGANARITREALENLPQETLDELIRLKEIEKAVMEGRTPPPRAIDVGGG